MFLAEARDYHRAGDLGAKPTPIRAESDTAKLRLEIWLVTRLA